MRGIAASTNCLATKQGSVTSQLHKSVTLAEEVDENKRDEHDSRDDDKYFGSIHQTARNSGDANCYSRLTRSRETSPRWQ